MFILFSSIVFCSKKTIVSKALNLSFEIDLSNYTAPSSADKQGSLIMANGNIVVAGTLCSFCGKKCKINFQIFSKDFKLAKQQLLQGQSTYDDFGGFIFTSDGYYLFQFLSQQESSDPRTINVYLISQDLELIKPFNYNKKANPGIIGLLYYPIEFFGNLNFYRIYFGFSTINSEYNNNVLSIDLNKDLSLRGENKENYFIDNKYCKNDRLYSAAFLQYLLSIK